MPTFFWKCHDQLYLIRYPQIINNYILALKERNFNGIVSLLQSLFHVTHNQPWTHNPGLNRFKTFSLNNISINLTQIEKEPYFLLLQVLSFIPVKIFIPFAKVRKGKIKLPQSYIPQISLFWSDTKLQGTFCFHF